MRLPPRRLKEIDDALDQALGLPSHQRTAFVARLADRDEALAAAVAALLAEAEATDSRLAAVGRPDLLLALRTLSSGSDLSPGDEVGRFRVLRELGRGGMAIVYLAERADGAFDQRVAIKRLHHGLGTVGALERFHQEKQILATLSHPSIARLLDGGVDASGFPYLVMEHVDGMPLDRHADDRRLSVRERLELFVRVARAVDFAHRHLVVHRDIKPSNILVTPDGEVKLLDFGIAKLIDAQEPSNAPLTRTVLRALTPEYASPEQLAGTRITIASDVYQLGLLLYELIAGVRARSIEQGSLIDAAAACARPVTRPSAAVAATVQRDEIARNRDTSPAALARALRGDLDNIVAMALNGMPDARYPTAAALGDDVLRHLSGRAVYARGEAPFYRATRFMRRHAVGVAAVAAIALLTAASAIIATLQASRIVAERDRAQVEAEKAQGVTQFLLGLFEIPPAAEAGYASLSAREVLEYRAARIDDLAGQAPLVRAEVMSTVGYALVRLGSHDRGIALIDGSLQIRRVQLGDDDVDTGQSLHRLGTGLNLRGAHEAAEPHLRRALAIRERVLGPRHVDVAETLTELAAALNRRGQRSEGEALLTRALAIDRDAGSDHQARVLNSLGLVKAASGDDDAAGELFTTAIEYRRARFGDNHPDLPTNLINLAGVRLRRYGPASAIPLLEQALAGRRRVFGDTHVNTHDVRMRLAAARLDAGELLAAERLLEEVERTVDPANGVLQRMLADRFVGLYERWGRRQDAERYRKRSAGQE